MTERKRYTKQTYGTPYNHIKPRQCKYDGAYTNGTPYKHEQGPRHHGKHKWLH